MSDKDRPEGREGRDKSIPDRDGGSPERDRSDFDRGAEALGRLMDGRSVNENADKQLRELEKSEAAPAPSPSPSPTPEPSRERREIRGSDK
jgi:hypothetical protein